VIVNEEGPELVTRISKKYEDISYSLEEG